MPSGIAGAEVAFSRAGTGVGSGSGVKAGVGGTFAVGSSGAAADCPSVKRKS